jgi:hypothetical protein
MKSIFLLFVCLLLLPRTSHAVDVADEFPGPEPVFTPDECLLPLKAEVCGTRRLGRHVRYPGAGKVPRR